MDLVLKAAILTNGIQRQDGSIAIALHTKIEFRVILPPHGIANNLRPEFGIAFPFEPVHRPSVFHIGGKHQSFSETELPSRQERFFAVRFKEHFCLWPRLGLDISEKLRRRLKINSLESLHIFCNKDFESRFLKRFSRGILQILIEDLGHSSRIFRVKGLASTN